MKSDRTLREEAERVLRRLLLAVAESNGDTRIGWPASLLENSVNGVLELIHSERKAAVLEALEKVSDLCSEYDGKSDTGEVSFLDLRAEVEDMIRRQYE